MDNHHKTFRLRLDVDYTGPDQIMTVYKLDPKTNLWQALPVNENTPGLLLFYIRC